MNNTIATLLERFYAGSIAQPELDALFDAFLHDAHVREAWPADAAVVLPLALARADARRRFARRPRTRRVAAAIFALLLAGGSVAVYAAEHRPRVYTTDPSCDASCAGLWLENTLRSAL